jgi:hypothetical protein
VEDLEGFQPTCEVHGLVRLPKPRWTPRGLREEPFQHQVAFNLPAPEMGRPRGLIQADVIGAVRAPRPQPAGGRLVFVDPHPGPTRPS